MLQLLECGLILAFDTNFKLKVTMATFVWDPGYNLAGKVSVNDLQPDH